MPRPTILRPSYHRNRSSGERPRRRPMSNGWMRERWIARCTRMSGVAWHRAACLQRARRGRTPRHRPIHVSVAEALCCDVRLGEDSDFDSPSARGAD